jgi:hypothetical protein
MDYYYVGDFIFRITYENPCELTEKKQQLGLEPPIDEIDGAARILDPVCKLFISSF